MDREEIANTRVRYLATLPKKDEVPARPAPSGGNVCGGAISKGVQCNMNTCAFSADSMSNMENELKNYFKAEIESLKDFVSGELDLVKTEISKQQTAVCAAVPNNPRQPSPALFDHCSPTHSIEEIKDETPALKFPFENVKNEKDCGICHNPCDGNDMNMCVPCGHFPYCGNCMKQVKDKNNNIPLLDRADDWIEYLFICPGCNGRCQSTLNLKFVKCFQ